MTDPKAEDLLRRAYALSGEDPAETKALYRDWAETYDGTMMDGLDYSAEMLAVAQAKGRIGQSFLRDLNEPLKMDGERFGALASTGTFTHGHVGGGCLPGLFELLEPGGLLVCTVHQDVWDAGGFGETLAQLEDAGAVQIVERKADRLFETDEAPTGWYLVARKR